MATINAIALLHGLTNAAICAFELSGATGPIIQSVTDPTEHKIGCLTSGGMVQLKGMNLFLKGDNSKVGILIVKEGQTTELGVFIPATDVLLNTPTKLQFILPPSVIQGKWHITISTQFNGNKSKLMKTPYSYTYPIAVTVNNEGNLRPSKKI